MAKFRNLSRLVVLVAIFCLQGPLTAGGLQETINIYIAFDLTSGEVLFQASGPGTSGIDINLYRDLQGFRTTSIRSMNRNGVQYTELAFKAENIDDPMLLERVFTHLLARKCTLRYDRKKDTFNLVINSTDGLHINSHNATDLLRPVDESVSKIMLVWPGNTDLFEVDASING